MVCNDYLRTLFSLLIFLKGEYLDIENCNVHLISTLVKAFLRELPIPILTFENYDPFMAAFGEFFYASFN